VRLSIVAQIAQADDVRHGFQVTVGHMTRPDDAMLGPQGDVLSHGQFALLLQVLSLDNCCSLLAAAQSARDAPIVELCRPFIHER
jgi:hypothetical protein